MFENSLDDTRTITVTVERDGAILYDESHDVAPSSNATILAGFTERNLTSENQWVNVTYATDGQEKTSRFRIHRTWRSITGFFNDSGGLQITEGIADVGPSADDRALEPHPSVPSHPTLVAEFEHAGLARDSTSRV